MTLGRYLLLVDWSKASIEPVAARMQDRLQFQTRFADHDCIILANDPGQLLAMPGERGMIIGTVFPRHGPASAIESSDRLWLEELDAPDPLTLLRDRFWGGYVGLDWQTGALRLFRDPGGAMPCYYMALPTGWAVSSDAEMLVEAGLLSPRIDWAEMPRYLTSKDLPSGRTGIEGLMELLAGSCVTLGPTMSAPRQYWSPWDHLAECDGWDGDAMAERLRRTVDHCVASWASTGDRTLATLSGGLDSSVVVAGLARAKRDFQCATLVAGDRLGDEREYARAMAAHAGAELHEAHYDPDDVDLDRSVARHFPKPIGTLHETAFHAAIMRRTRALGAAAVFTGNGGDSIFYNSSSVRPLFDFLRSRGPAFQAITVFRNICEVTRSGRTAALRAVIRSIPAMRRPYVWRQNFALLTDDLVTEMSSQPPSHPWLDVQPLGRPGKVGHVSHLLKVQNHLEGYLRPYDMPMINPLMSQPVVELALGIPTWRMIEGGRDRAVVRKAYAQALPSIVRDRRRKGSPSGFAMDVLLRNAAEVRERLMDGELARRHLVHAERVAAVIPQARSSGHMYVRLLILLDMEAWISHWRALGG
ncbi:asparagine synthase [Sphingobium sp. TB-6]|uniref:asparagine synthase-related protein n=1 Tax=Sphingobium sp. TB-6 TaxID=2728850 RepID=UPI00146F478E|nr:asparagine synthase C-terminal domain-containing protein [Sphingobium sp. TB-6]NML91202.1 asparagine synthase [Sphingobium sp. TB-6]